ncbi:esterase-like activity of phytase family protein [Sphingomonas sp. SRS2]|uniref:esterase-like activity of phytase family protein n=1 Tax=Sphingomonas sp. SRS2 TaxID=133190 RepID=UPI0006184366|nr:esterase-like activity of phytase family protein [Sphingomonas sp. SRS2]KKC25645.1 hypothetical protein WP12_12600 [Sphingomonas sp. SRS2]
MKKALAALLFCLVPGSAGFPQAANVPVVATPIAIDPDDPAHRKFGRLRYVAGWHLTSRQRNFGGYSALRVEGDQILALADTGDHMRFRLSPDGVLSDTRFGRLTILPSYRGDRGDRDSESMTFGPEGDIWVGFEHGNAILRYAPEFKELIGMAFPPAMRKWSPNSGAEAMTRLDGGRFVVFAEGQAVAPHVHAALLFPGDPTNPKNVPFSFGYRPPLGYVPTDAQQLPDGRIAVLHRHFSLFEGFWTAIALVDPAAIKPGATVTGELIAELKPPLNVDNMEGLSITREGGRTMMWIISDDNQVPVERTLLLKFELMER